MVDFSRKPRKDLAREFARVMQEHNVDKNKNVVADKSDVYETDASAQRDDSQRDDDNKKVEHEDTAPVPSGSTQRVASSFRHRHVVPKRSPYKSTPNDDNDFSL